MTYTDTRITISVSARTLEAAINTLEACSTDPREPQRYRDWYAEAATELRNETAERPPCPE